MFNEVRPKKAALEIISQIRQAILAGQLRPGDRLPAERELIASFGVSKNTMREALRVLEVMGFLTIRQGPGGGAEVMAPDMQTTQDSIANFLHFKNISITDLSEARRVVEPYLARLAAGRLRQGELERLESLNEACRLALSRGESLVGSADEVNFHRTLAHLSENPVLILITDLVNSLLADSKVHLRPGPDFSRRVLSAHERILAALQARDGERAAQEMLDHIDEVERELLSLRQESDLAAASRRA
ncbi:MAG: FadR/GntR family transcriptional regulator [Thermodesulfobacteriota bacterium]